MRIAHLCTKYWNHSETFIRQLAVGWAHAGHQVEVMAGHVTPLASADAHPNLRIEHVPFLPGRTLLARALRKAADHVEGLRPLYPRISGRIHARRVITSRLKRFKPDVVYCDYGTTGVLALDAAQELGLPLVVHFHGADASAAMAREGYRDAVRELLKSDAHIVVPSHHLRRLLVLACGVEPNVTVIPYGVSRNATLPTEKTAWPSVICLGWLTSKKHPIATLHAFRRVLASVPDARMTMIGGGPLRAEVEGRIRVLGLQKSVTLTGPLDHADALALMASHWVFAQHSVTSPIGDQEGLPVAVLEAMAHGVPPVTTLHSGIPEAVTHGDSGFLVQEHDYEQMAYFITMLLQKPELRHRMSAAARCRAATLHEECPRVDAVTAVLCGAISSQARGRDPAQNP